MDILDETVTSFAWSRSHDVVNGNLFCTVSIFDGDKWIEKQDVGTESNTEKEKGEASDSFKRACVNWGIGRELYTAPFIWIKLEPNEVKTSNGRSNLAFGVKFTVESVTYDEHRRIQTLVIKDQNGKVRFSHGKQAQKPVSETKPAEPPKTPEPPKDSAKEQPVVSADQIKSLYTICKEHGKNQDDLKAFMTEKFGFDSSKKLTKPQYDQTCQWAEGK